MVTEGLDLSSGAEGSVPHDRRIDCHHRVGGFGAISENVALEACQERGGSIVDGRNDLDGRVALGEHGVEEQQLALVGGAAPESCEGMAPGQQGVVASRHGVGERSNPRGAQTLPSRDRGCDGVDVNLTMPRNADNHFEQAARHGRDADHGDPLGKSRRRLGTNRAEALKSIAHLLGLGDAESSDERPPEIGLPDLMSREWVTVGGDIAALRPSSEHGGPIHLVAVEQIGHRAGSNDIVDAIGEPQRPDRPGESIDGPVVADVVAERSGSQSRREDELDVRRDTEALGQTLGEPVPNAG